MTWTGCPKCNKIFCGEFPCPSCGWMGPYREPQTVYDLDKLDKEQVYAREIWHPKIDIELH